MDAVAATAPSSLPATAVTDTIYQCELRTAVAGSICSLLCLGTDITHHLREPAGCEGPQRSTTWGRSCRFYGSHAVTLARSYKIGKRSALKDINHEVAIDDLSDVSIRLH